MKLFFSFLILFFCLNVKAVETAITVLTTSETALTEYGSSSTDESNGFSVSNLNCDVMLLLNNTTSAASATVTVTVQDASVTLPGYGPLTKSSLATTLDAVGGGQRKIVGPFPCSVWNNSSGSIVGTVTGTNAANVAITPFRFDKSTSGL